MGEGSSPHTGGGGLGSGSSPERATHNIKYRPQAIYVNKLPAGVVVVPEYL